MQPQWRRKVPPEMNKEALARDLPLIEKILGDGRLPFGSKPRSAQRYLVIRLMLVLAQVLVRRCRNILNVTATTEQRLKGPEARAKSRDSES